MRWVWIAGLLAACKSSSKATEGSAHSETLAAGGSAGSAVLAAVSIDAKAPDTCADACVFLADNTLATVKTKFESTCGGSWSLAFADCDSYQYVINCIYAARGYVFKRPEWKDRFTSKPWYKARSDFKETDLSAAARETIKQLRGEQKSCVKAAAKLPEVSAADRELAKKAYSALLERAPADAEGPDWEPFEGQFRAFIIAGDMDHDSTAMRYDSLDGSKRTIVISNFFVAAGPGQYDTDGHTVSLTFDGDKLVAWNWD